MFTRKKLFRLFGVVFTAVLFLLTNGYAQDDSDRDTPNYSDSNGGTTDGYDWEISIEAQS